MSICKQNGIEYSYLALAASISSLIGVVIYQKFLKKYEVRNLLCLSIFATTFNGLCGYFLSLGWNRSFYIADIYFLFGTNILSSTLNFALGIMPIVNLFVKITPRGLEGTIYACLTGVLNLQKFIIAPKSGEWINDNFFGVSAQNMENYKLLMLVSFLIGPLSLFLLPLVPKQEEIDENIRRRLAIENQYMKIN